jgi:osmotically-inducible protein OsmY
MKLKSSSGNPVTTFTVSNLAVMTWPMRRTAYYLSSMRLGSLTMLPLSPLVAQYRSISRERLLQSALIRFREPIAYLPGGFPPLDNGQNMPHRNPVLKPNEVLPKAIPIMKNLHSLALLAATGALLLTSAPLRASEETDDRIESAANKSHVFKTYLKDDSIKTVSKNGVVTLTGTVADASHSSLAENTVESLPGVKSVDNQLKVKGESPAEHSDGWIGAKVKTTLLFHRNVRATKTDVNVADGVVTLSGEASSLAQKELTTEYAQDVEGVKSVNNTMTISKAPAKPDQTIAEKIDDASITAQVKSSLRSHHSTSALKTKVETMDGVVTISGVAKNHAEKSLVTKLINDIDGVTSVVNNMTIPTASLNPNSLIAPPQNLRLVGN